MLSIRSHSLRLILHVLPVLFLTGCMGEYYYDTLDYDEHVPRGVYHHVLKGQTLYSIAQAYGVSVSELQRINGIHDPSDMEVATELWIPGASRVLYVPPTVEAAASPDESYRDPPDGKRDEPEDSRSASRRRTASKPPPAARKNLLWPVKGGILTSRFGTRDGKNHHGIDISAPRGTYIRAADGGIVKFSGWGPRGYGKMIIVKHPGNLTTVYAHNSSNLVKKGTKVKRGQAIAKVGTTGRATGPHVHFEVRNDTHPKNPLFYLNVREKTKVSRR